MPNDKAEKFDIRPYGLAASITYATQLNKLSKNKNLLTFADDILISEVNSTRTEREKANIVEPDPKNGQTK